MADPVATLEYVRAHLEDALATDARVAQGGLRVEIEDAGLLITGSVPTRDRHDAVSVVAAEVASGFVVRNATEPVPLGSPVASEEL
jgi:hypothetical protein